MSNDYIEISEEKLSKNEKKVNFEVEKVNNASNKFQNNENLLKTNSSQNEKINDVKQGKWLVILTIIILAYFIYQPLTGAFINYLQNNPSMYKIYLTLFSEINNNTINGLFIVSILGALFFMVLPSEAIFIYYLSSTYYNPILIIIMVILGTMVGLTFNYFFGRILGEKLLKFIFKKNFDKYKNTIDKWGGTFVFLGNIFPGPMEVLSVFFGGFKFSYKKFIILSILGRLIKYIILFFAFTFFWETITLYYENFLNLL